VPGKDIEFLKPLVSRIVEFAARPSEAGKKELWARHNALLPTDKIPVTVTYEGIPSPQWELMLGPDHMRATDPLARDIEWDLKRRIWAAEHIADDHIVWPALFISAVVKKAAGWGVPLEWKSTGDELGAKSIVAPFADGIDTKRVAFRDFEIDERETRLRVEKARQLTGGALAVHVIWPSLGHSPFEVATEMRGMEALLLDTLDAPQAVDRLMDAVTGAYEAHHARRERKGWLNVFPMDDGAYIAANIWRVHAWYARKTERPFRPMLEDEWAYVSAQSAAGLGPAAFERFVHRFNSRLALLFTKKTVYYHGCERLDHKLHVLQTLPNLRRLHVSPWSSVAAAREEFQGKVALEVHAHPGKVFFTMTPDDMRREIRALIDAAEGVPMDLNLSDINSVNGNPETLTTWSRIAQEGSRHW